MVPDINNTINMVPVDHVARIVSLAAVHPLADSSLTALHVTASPPPTYNGMFSALPAYGYAVEQCEYLVWRRKLEQHIMKVQDNALFPLLHFVLDDLPTSTKAPELNDTNTRAILSAQREPETSTVDPDLMGLYLAWLVDSGFLPPPGANAPQKLPKLRDGAHARAVGRSGI